METRIVHHDGRQRTWKDVRHQVQGVRCLLEGKFVVEYHPSGIPWLPEHLAVLVLTDTQADYRMVFDLGDATNPTKQWWRLEQARGYVSAGGLLEFDEADDDEDDDAPAMLTVVAS